MGFRDALMVSGFDLLGHNRTFQVHWLKRVVAFFLDLITVFAPLWSFLYLEGVRAPWVYGVAGGVVLYAYSTFSEAITRTTVGKFIVGLEVRSLRGPMSLSKAAVRNFPKLFWFAFPLLDTLAGLVVDGDPRQRWSDKILGTTVAQSHLIHVRVHPIEASDAGGR
ncbi:MAG: RDD family protein [Methanobacteriota archaeon]|nr:MAG: RDD family protein [Euryarchaeota archaeon]